MSDTQYEILDAALSGMVKGPRPLGRLLAAAPDLAGIEGEMGEEDLLQRLASAVPDDTVRNRLRTSLAGWDFVEWADWTADTEPNTVARRALIYERLALREDLRRIIDTTLAFAWVERPIVISDKFTPWYTEDVRRGRNFYWTAYSRYLAGVRNFAPENIESLDSATNSVMERLTNPEQVDTYQARGLVVGHVQSGKTANFTGVIAKAIDSGYRLVIVLSGTMDLLRDQTQRRIDMELVGKELVRRSEATGEAGERFDYDDDPDWEVKFISHRGKPAELGAFDIERLTGAGQGKRATGDYQSLRHGIRTLEIEKLDKQKPLYDPVNLHPSAVRLLVIKKNEARLKKLVNDLRKIGVKALGEVPSLIIDDESDQASINTIKPDKSFLEKERKRRTAINQRLTELLTILPRSQYVGYTATPFANVFVDPDDEEDIYPKDFIIGLPRPTGYMGVRDFHDIDMGSQAEAASGMSNEESFVRGVTEPHEESTDKLQEAIDTFVLTGAIKLYRRRLGLREEFRHHTMLIHESQLQADHTALGRLIEDLWDEAGYDGGSGPERLRRLLAEDILPVARLHAPDLPTPSTLKEIRKELGEAIRRIEAEGPPVLIVNGTKEADTPDFDKKPVWKMVVGGAKLSRGYTVEGLTVSYFRRRAGYQDTLMQMGRWFGFRPGYRDLVRLYIGRHEPLTAAGKRFIDLYEAFEAICRDEEEFRAQLSQYATPADGSEPLTPYQVVPFVRNTHPQLTPVAKNKMYYAELKAQNYGGDWVARTLCSDKPEDLNHNEELFSTLLGDMDLQRSKFSTEVDEGRIVLDSFWGLVGHKQMVDVLAAYRWAPPHTTSLLKLEVEFLRGDGVGDPAIDDWILLLPQLKKSARDLWCPAGYELTSIERAKAGPIRFNVFTESKHVTVAEVLVGKRAGKLDGPIGAERRDRRRGVMILYAAYPIREVGQEIPTMGFSFRPPVNDLPKVLVFSALRGKDQESEPAGDVLSKPVRSRAR